MTISIPDPVTALLYTFFLCSVLMLCASAVAYSAICQLVRTIESFFAMFDSQPGRTPATPLTPHLP